ncbi:unnamed protein product [Urochloa decumbens]|uniref:RING-type E3 ubiquitin transferase n=1 Tax=Urochloa decumbens TaxID=240449 RepID=A0ABC9FT64_9POAL
MASAGVRRAGGRFRAPEVRTGGGGSGYYFLGGYGGGGFSRVLEEASAPAVDNAPATAGREAAPTASAMAARITPAVLFVTVVLAVVLLVSGLLHLLRRLFLKTHHGGAGGGERQLQHLFFPGGNGEDGAGGSGGGGLAQAAIDALPEFAYAELSAAAAASASRKGKEKAARPFDCAVCLCEFAGADRLRLLPSCGHAFHVACIDVWLRSSATCPLCRTKLSPRHLAAAAADADAASAGPDADDQNQQQDQAPDEAAAVSSVVLPVRLGRFTCADGGDDAEAGTSNSGSRVDGRRRCYSMGSYQYVLADEHLLVSVHMRHGNADGAGTGTAAGGAAAGGCGDRQGKKVFARGDSFSVSKIWQWRGSKRLPASLCADDGLPWAPVAKDPAATHTRQQQQRGDT